jgi:hypothetical protein
MIKVILMISNNDFSKWKTPTIIDRTRSTSKMKWLLIGGGLFAIFLVCVLTIAFWVMSINNGEVQLRTKFEAQQNLVESSMDNMRKTLMSQYKVSKDFADTFIKVVAMNAEGRKGGTIFKSVTESSGNVIQGFTPELSMKMMNSIEGKMSEFKRAQDVWVDIWREHKTFCATMPNSFIVGSRVFPKPEVISSDAAKEAMKTGKLSDNILGAEEKSTPAEK